jgi:LysM repeat protein
MATEKAYLKLETGTRIPCLFNPTEFGISKSNEWTPSETRGGVEPQLSFAGAQPGSMSLDLTFDTTDSGRAVTSYTDQLMTLMQVDPSLPGSDEQSNNVRPPTVTFHWGQLRTFTAVVTSLNVTFTYFSSSGVPLRAKANLQLQQYKPDNVFGPQNPTSGTPRPHRVHRVQPGETLDRIAAHHYGDSTRWRLLADANGISDPLAVRPGSVLAVPRDE